MTTEEFLLNAMTTISKEYANSGINSEYSAGMLFAIKSMLRLNSEDEAHELLTITEQISRQSRGKMRAIVRPGHIVIIDHKDRRTEHRFGFTMLANEIAKLAIDLHNNQV